jgi:hypothetical protein
MTIESVGITPGSGKNIAVDTVTSQEYQCIKIALGAEDAMDCLIDSGQQTMANSLPIAIASNQSALPITDNSGSLTIDQPAHDSLNANANLQVGNADVAVGNPVPVQTKDDVLELTLSLDTGVYATGEVLADTQELTSFFPVSAKGVTIQSIGVLDEDDQAGALDIVFLKSSVTLGTENAAVSISDANAREILGIVSVVAGDYVDLVGCQYATICPVGLPVKTAGTSIWVGAISRDAKTYSASGLKLKIGIV